MTGRWLVRHAASRESPEGIFKGPLGDLARASALRAADPSRTTAEVQTMIREADELASKLLEPHPGEVERLLTLTIADSWLRLAAFQLSYDVAVRQGNATIASLEHHLSRINGESRRVLATCKSLAHAP